MNLPECTTWSCYCFNYTCECGAPYKYDDKSYHLPNLSGKCEECDKELPLKNILCFIKKDYCDFCKTEHDWSGFTHADWNAFCSCGCRCPLG